MATKAMTATSGGAKEKPITASGNTMTIADPKLWRGLSVTDFDRRGDFPPEATSVDLRGHVSPGGAQRPG